MIDEKWEETQDLRLNILEERMSSSFDSLINSSEHFSTKMTRFQNAKEKIYKYNEIDQVDFDGRLKQLEIDSQKIVRRVEDRLSTFEDDVNAASARDYMARAAAHLRQSEVIKMQRIAAVDVENMIQKVNKIKIDLHKI
mmetsp:Transcript_9206/g.13052  ORF Transcript_9206/g.13052 Transcript_9206/m.13052 type:complete len:139 (-) Transcript_9206:218-634(-)